MAMLGKRVMRLMLMLDLNEAKAHLTMASNVCRHGCVKEGGRSCLERGDYSLRP